MGMRPRVAGSRHPPHLMAALLKDIFDRPWLDELGRALARRHPAFDRAGFVSQVLAPPWPDLELKQRMRCISQAARRHLPDDYRQALAVWLAAAPEFSGLPAMVFPDLVEAHGQDDWDASVPALRQLTRYSSSEFAVRPFLRTDLPRMMAAMEDFSQDHDEHVRRLASEGSRPRLPWAMQVPALRADPSPVLPILARLRADPSETVRRSVANNLNDIAKDHPERVLELTERWLGEGAATDRLLKHGCRTLLKRGSVRALRLFGFDEPAGVRVLDLAPRRRRLRVGETLEFTFTLVHEAAAPARVRLEVAVDYVKARGRTGRKIFKISERDLAPGRHPMTRRQAFRDLSTRRHYPGRHRVTLRVNGVDRGGFDLELLP